jgi:hypothetical protein
LRKEGSHGEVSIGNSRFPHKSVELESSLEKNGWEPQNEKNARIAGNEPTEMAELILAILRLR